MNEGIYSSYDRLKNQVFWFLKIRSLMALGKERGNVLAKKCMWHCSNSTQNGDFTDIGRGVRCHLNAFYIPQESKTTSLRG